MLFVLETDVSVNPIGLHSSSFHKRQITVQLWHYESDQHLLDLTVQVWLFQHQVPNDANGVH